MPFAEPATPVPFLGRDSEFDRLRGLIDDAAEGRLRTVVVEGEAGIGKTRLLAESLSHARDLGYAVLEGTAHELERVRPFAALIDALDLDRETTDRDPVLGPMAHGGRDGGIADRSVAAEPDVGFRVIESILDRIESLASSAPVVLALEDLHWVDPSTLRAVRSIHRRLADVRLVMILTMRPSPRVPEVDRLTDELLRGGGFHLAIGSLDDDAVAALTGMVVGAAPGPALLEHVAGAGGNPLFVIELVRALQDDGAVTITDGQAEVHGASLPPSLRLTILRRLSGLPAETLETLRIASVLGSSFSMLDLVTVMGRTAIETLSRLRTALEGGLIVEMGDQLSFRHDLIRYALYQDQPEAVRKALHREAGRALIAAGAQAISVVQHLALGASPGDTVAVDWLHRAAREAAPQGLGVAGGLLERALELTLPGSHEWSDILPELVLALCYVGRATEAEAMAREALLHHLPLPGEARLREGLAVALERKGDLSAAREQFEVIARSSRHPERTRAAALADASILSVMMADTDGARSFAAEALIEGGRLDDPYAVCVSEASLCIAADAEGNVAEAVEHGGRAAALLHPVWQRTGGHAFPNVAYGCALIDADRLDDAERAFLEGRAHAEDAGAVTHVPTHLWGVVAVRYLRGDWDGAGAEAEAGLALVEDTGYRAGTLLPNAVLACIALHRDEPADAQARIQAGESDMAESGPAAGLDWFLWSRALLAEARDDATSALAILGGAWDLWRPLRYFVSYRSMGPDLVRIALAAGETERARSVTQDVEEGARRSRVPTAEGAALRCRGLVEGDAELLVASVRAYRRGQRSFELALACEDAAASLAGAGRRDEAVPLIDEALTVFDSVGAIRDVARAGTTIRSLGVRRGRRPRRPSTGWQALTPAERGVVRLVVEGLTNPQIAKRLFVSRYTVDTHLKHVFTKLGIGSRSELAAEAARRNESF